MDNYRKHQALKSVELEQLKNVLHQFGKRVNFSRYKDTDNPVLIVNEHHGGWCGNVEFKSVWLDKNGRIRCKAESAEYGWDIDVDIEEDVSYGFIGYLTEEVINVGKNEGIVLDPCRFYGEPLQTSKFELAERADSAVLAYLERHDYDGNIVQNDESLTLYLGGMEFDVESLFVDGNCNPAAFGTSYEMEADVRINRLGSRQNLERIIEYCERN